MIFGDGAGALVLGEGDGFLSSCLNSQGDDETLALPTNVYNSPWARNEYRKPAVKMDGQRTFRYAVGAIVKDVETVLEQAGCTPEEVKWVVPHQANQRIISAAARRMKGIPEERFVCNIGEYGNTSSASIPIALDELNRAGKLSPGDLVALVAFGGGLADGAVLLRW
jgi:3-oxoacyl-[acyl-carrier-protein] synthase-3